MRGKAQHELIRRAASPELTKLLASAICIDYRRHLVNMIKQNTVTEFTILSVFF